MLNERRVAIGAGLLAGSLATTIALPVAGADACRVRNITEHTSGGSLIRMVGKARDGDRLWVRGTCEGPIVIRSDITIRGLGERPTLTGREEHRVVRIARRADVTLIGLAIQRGRTRNGLGAAILNDGRLIIRDSIVQGSRTKWDGGGVFNGYEAELTLVDSVVRGNRAGRGGGIANDIGGVTLIRTAVKGNAATGVGGGIMQMSDEGGVSLIDSAVVGNRAGGHGGGIDNHGYLSLTRSSVRDNSAAGGGGIYTSYSLWLTDSTVTRNTAGVRGGGVRNAPYDEGGTVTLEGTSSVTGNTPDDCVGTPSC
jgi:hypothetical protein